MKALAKLLQGIARPLNDAAQTYDPLLTLVGNARIVLLGTQTHGTHEFYCERAVVTRRLIEEKGFNAVAVEADWPDSYRVNRFIRGQSDDADAVEALAGFTIRPSVTRRGRHHFEAKSRALKKHEQRKETV